MTDEELDKKSNKPDYYLDHPKSIVWWVFLYMPVQFIFILYPTMTKDISNISKQGYFEPWLEINKKGLEIWKIFMLIVCWWSIMATSHMTAKWFFSRRWKRNPLPLLSYLILNFLAIFLAVELIWRFWGDQLPYILNLFASPPK